MSLSTGFLFYPFSFWYFLRTLDEKSLRDCHTINACTIYHSLSPSCSLSHRFTPCKAAIFLIMNISFVLITRINDWFGYLNASFRETWLPCHGYKLQADLCFTWGFLLLLVSPLLLLVHTYTRGVLIHKSMFTYTHCGNKFSICGWYRINPYHSYFGH